MAHARGQVVVRDWKTGRGYALRFVAYGKRRYVTLGLHHDGWTPRKAREELANVLADVRRGLWIPPDHHPPDRDNHDRDAGPEREPTFHEFASDWLHSREGEIGPCT
ncbi:MAG: hypothetical protein Q8O56_12135 [Solirubrobacteraceae bacterium]|nr:hypothetical protein [Solirubrobacteraceae bacterium]